MRRRRAVPRLVAVALISSMWAAVLPGCRSSGGAPRDGTPPAGPEAAGAVVVDTGDRKITFQVELARTEAARERGLMYRERLAPTSGMLFLFERQGPLTFWMKNTLIPLDMVFIDRDLRVVGIVADAEPQTLTPRRVDGASQYVLEIGGGLAARLGIRPGNRVELRGVSPLP